MSFKANLCHPSQVLIDSIDDNLGRRILLGILHSVTSVAKYSSLFRSVNAAVALLERHDLVGDSKIVAPDVASVFTIGNVVADARLSGSFARLHKKGGRPSPVHIFVSYRKPIKSREFWNRPVQELTHIHS